MRLKDKVALITGGSSGIGQAIALRLAEERAKVIVSSWEEKELENTVNLIESKGGTVKSYQADVQNKTEVSQLIQYSYDAWGKIDVLVNSAGICRGKPFLEITESDWDDHMNINVKSAFLTSQEIIKRWQSDKTEGSIINVSSVNGIQVENNQVHYNASKAAMNLLTQSIALEFAAENIRVNALCPGFIETRLTRRTVDNPDRKSHILQSIPMERIGVPDDVAKAAVFLASDDSSYITGHCLVVDGGQVIKLS